MNQFFCPMKKANKLHKISFFYLFNYLCNIVICSAQRTPLCFVYLIIIIITDECLLISRLRGRVPWSNFQGQCRAKRVRDRVKANDVCGRRGVEMDERGGSSLSGERGTALALPLYGTRSKTRDTTSVARYISKVKDLLFSALLEPIHIRDYTTFHRPLFTPSATLARSHV